MDIVWYRGRLFDIPPREIENILKRLPEDATGFFWPRDSDTLRSILEDLGAEVDTGSMYHFEDSVSDTQQPTFYGQGADRNIRTTLGEPDCSADYAHYLGTRGATTINLNYPDQLQSVKSSRQVAAPEQFILDFLIDLAIRARLIGSVPSQLIGQLTEWFRTDQFDIRSGDHLKEGDTIKYLRQVSIHNSGRVVFFTEQDNINNTSPTVVVFPIKKPAGLVKRTARLN